MISDERKASGGRPISRRVVDRTDGMQPDCHRSGSINYARDRHDRCHIVDERWRPLLHALCDGRVLYFFSAERQPRLCRACQKKEEIDHAIHRD